MAYNVPVTRPSLEAHSLPHQAYEVLHFGFVLIPLVAGLDKFFHLLTNWNQYLAPQVTDILRIPAQTFMLGVGVVEIVAALLVAFAPRIGSWVVAAWMLGTACNLVIHPSHFYDIALRDIGLLFGALALGKLAQWEHDQKTLGRGI